MKIMKEEIPENVSKSIEEIKLDNTSGSMDLAKKSALLLYDLVNIADSQNIINKTAYSLIKAQPNMASIFNLVNNLMFEIDDNNDKELKNIVQKYCKKFLKNIENSDKLIGNQAIKLVKNDETIITHSYSSTVFNALLFLKENKKNFSVICTESRPKNEGLNLAKNLGKNFIKVKLVVDSAVYFFIPDADIILLGCDAITRNGLINKIGTKGIAITASYYKTPIYALCSTNKFLPYNYQIGLDIKKNPNEIINEELLNVKPINYYFEKTPFEFFTGFITEKEILEPEDIKDEIKNLKIHKNINNF